MHQCGGTFQKFDGNKFSHLHSTGHHVRGHGLISPTSIYSVMMIFGQNMPVYQRERIQMLIFRFFFLPPSSPFWHLPGQDFTRFIAYELYTIQWNHLQMIMCFVKKFKISLSFCEKLLWDPSYCPPPQL